MYIGQMGQSYLLETVLKEEPEPFQLDWFILFKLIMLEMQNYFCLSSNWWKYTKKAIYCPFLSSHT